MIQMVKLSKLVPSSLNVRKIREDVAEQFAASIAAKGLLQNLVVTPLKKPRGSFGIVAGESRYAGMLLLASRGEIVADDYDVPVKLMTGDDMMLSETSLTENFQRNDLTPADECRGFHLILSQGGDVEGVAKRFGVTRRFVEGRLRLATLAEPIFEALASGKITLDLAKAYASTANHERQLLVWNSYGHNSYQSADSIRRIIANESMKSSDPVARLVGAEAYEAAGGVVDRDLFSNNGDRWTNPEIAQRLAAALMEAEAKRIGDERGLAWIRPVATDSTWDAARGLFRVTLPRQPMSDDDMVRAATIGERIEALEAEMADEELAEDGFQAFEAEYEELQAELLTIQQRPAILPPELASRVGAFLTLSQTGEMVLDGSFYSETPLTVTVVAPEQPTQGSEDDGTGDDGEQTERVEPAPTTFRIEEGSPSGATGKSGEVDPDAAAPGGKALSQVLQDQLAVQRRDVLGAALIANPGLALDYMLFVMVDERTEQGSRSGTTIRASTPQDPVLSNNVPGSRARDYLAEVHDGLDASWTASSDKVARFEAFRILGDEVKAAWLAWVVATSLEAKESYTTGQNAMQNRLATILEVDVATWWRPTSENFFDRVSKGTMLSLLDEVGGPALSGRHASQKKTEISASCQKLFAGDAIVEAEVKEAALSWVPSAMRFNDTPTTGDTEANDGETGDLADLADLIGDGPDGEDQAAAGEDEVAPHANDEEPVEAAVAAE